MIAAIKKGFYTTKVLGLLGKLAFAVDVKLAPMPVKLATSKTVSRIAA